MERVQLTGSRDTPAPTPRVILLIRVQLVASAVSVLGGVVAGILFLAALFSHQAILGKAALIALIASLLGLAVIYAWRAWFLWHSGAWIALDGKRRSQAEQPGRFKTWLTLHLLFAAIYGAAASYLALFAFRF